MLMATEEEGGGIVILPPGGGGSKLRPPVPAVLGLEAPPFLVVMFYKRRKRRRAREKKREVTGFWKYRKGGKNHTHPNTQLDGLSFLEAQIQLGTSVHFLRFFGNLRFLLYPPSVKEQVILIWDSLKAGFETQI